MSNVVQGPQDSGPEFDELAKHVQATFDANVNQYGKVLYSTKAEGLSGLYVDAFPEEFRQHHNCMACREFIRRFGHAVFITPDGKTIPALWNPEGVLEYYKPSVQAVYDRVARQGVKGVFYTEFQTWGIAKSPSGWTHLSIDEESTILLPATGVGFETVKHAAKKRDNFDLLEKAINAFSLEVLRAGVNLLSSNDLMQAERYVGAVTWLYELKKQLDGMTDGKAKRNVLWFQVCNVTDSYARVGQSLVGTLLEDLRDGTPKHVYVRKFNEKADPLKYQRTIAAPTKGNVEVARKLFTELGLTEEDLLRRIAKPEELQYLWQPKVPEVVEAPKKELFGSLTTKEKGKVTEIDSTPTSAIRTSVALFMEKYLPSALSIEMRLAARRLPFYVFTTAVKEDAGQIFFYDTEEHRNRFSWFTPKDGQVPSYYKAPVNVWIPVFGITNLPASWFGQMARYTGTIFVAESFRNGQEPESCIFPELLDPKLHEVRRVIDQFSKDTAIAVSETDKHAIGVKVQEGAALEVRVTTEFGKQLYLLDREV